MTFCAVGHVPGGVGGLDAVAEAVGRRLEVVLGNAGSDAGSGDADLAVGPYGVEAVGTGAGVGGAEAVAGDTDVVGGRHDRNHGAGSLVLGVVEGLAGGDHRGGFVHVGDVEGDVLCGGHVPGGVGGLDAVAEAVGRRLEVVLGTPAATPAAVMLIWPLAPML